MRWDVGREGWDELEMEGMDPIFPPTGKAHHLPAAAVRQADAGAAVPMGAADEQRVAPPPIGGHQGYGARERQVGGKGRDAYLLPTREHGGGGADRTGRDDPWGVVGAWLLPPLLDPVCGEEAA